MNEKIQVKQNVGIISTGDNAQNTLIHNSFNNIGEIDWKRLTEEVENLNKNPDTSIKQFASEATEAIEEKDSSKVKSWLAKWMPCIGKLIETSYYILEIAAKLGISI